MSSFRLMPVRSSRGVFRSVEKMRTVFSPQSCCIRLWLLDADVVVYPAQVDEAVQQDKRQEKEDSNPGNRVWHAFHAAVDATGTAHGKGRQLVDDELHLVWSQYETFRL